MAKEYVELDLGILEEDQRAMVDAVMNEGALRLQESLIKKIDEKVKDLGPSSGYSDWERGYHSALLYARRIIKSELD